MTRLSELLDELEAGIAAPGFRDRAAEFEAAFRGDMLPREVASQLWRHYQSIWADYKKTQAERSHNATTQLSALQRQLDVLKTAIQQPSFRALAKEFEERLRASHALFRPQRDALWSLYQELWSSRKACMVERNTESDRAKSQYDSELWSIDVGYDGAPIMQSFDNWERVGQKVRTAREKLKAMQRAVREDRLLLPCDRKAVFDRIQDVWHRADVAEKAAFVVHGERAAELYNAASDAVDHLRPGEAAAIFKANQAGLRSLWLPRGDRDRYREWFNELWQRLQSRRDRARGEWRERQEAGLDKLLQAREKCRDALDRVRANNRQNEERLEDAHSNEFRDRVSEWLREGEERERDIERSLGELDAKIADAQSRLDR